MASLLLAKAGFASDEISQLLSDPLDSMLEAAGQMNEAGRRGSTVHPMAFSFPRRHPSVIYFPTLHIHDGKIHEQAEFDHILYCQAGGLDDGDLEGWEVSTRIAKEVMNKIAYKKYDIIDPYLRVARREIIGIRENADTLVAQNGVR
jgi:hypothetical protein